MKIEKKKQYLLVTITVFDYEDRVLHCIYTLKQSFKNCVILLLSSNSQNSMKDFNRFMTNKTKHDKNIFLVIFYNFSLAHKY